MKQIEIDGIWWLPGYSEEKIAGVLDYDDIKGGRLRLIGGNFSGRSTQKSHDNFDYELICGLGADGKEITLWECTDVGHTFTASGYTGQVLSVNFIFSGCHYQSVVDIQFIKVAINYSFLEQWLNLSTFDSEWRSTKSGEFTGYSTHYNLPQIPDYKFQSIKITFYYTIDSEVDMNTSSFSQSAYVAMESEVPLHFDNFQKYIIYPLRNLLTLGIGRTVVPNRIIGWSPTHQSDSLIQSCYTDIYASHEGHDVLIPNTLIPEKMLFTYRDVEEGFDDYLSKWFDLSSKIAPVMDLYFSLFFIRSMYVHSQFLTLAQALETYHRRLHGGTYMTETEYEQIKEQIIAAIPDTLSGAHRAKLEGGLNWGNEYSLRKRIKSILKKILSPYDPLCPESKQLCR